jgi:hypothetical protein
MSNGGQRNLTKPSEETYRPFAQVSDDCVKIVQGGDVSRQISG